MKKVLVVILTLAMLVIPQALTVQAEEVSFGKTMIGCFNLNWTSSPYNEWKAYLEEYIGPYYNVEFIFNTESADAEGEKTFLEKAGAVGANGVIGIVTFNLDNCLDICSQYGMKYVANSVVEYNQVDYTDAQVDAFAGCVGAGNTFRTEGGYEIAMACFDMLNTDEPIVVKALGINPAAGLPPTAPPLLQMQGIEKAVEELQANGAQVDFEEIYPSGFGPADWAEATDNALAGIGGADNAAILSASSIDYSVQSVLNANAVGKVVFGGFQGVTEGNKDYFRDGVINVSGEVGLPCNAPALSFVMLYNAMTGTKIANADGNPVIIEQTTPITVTSYDDYEVILAHSYSASGETYYSTDVLNQYIGIVTPDVNAESFAEFANADLR